MNVIQNTLEILTEDGDAIPVPLSHKQYSGRFHVRITLEMHHNLAMQAAEQGVSLNRHVSAKLAH